MPLGAKLRVRLEIRLGYDWIRPLEQIAELAGERGGGIEERLRRSIARHRTAESRPETRWVRRPLRLADIAGRRGPAQLNAGFNVQDRLSATSSRAEDEDQGGRHQLAEECSSQFVRFTLLAPAYLARTGAVSLSLWRFDIGMIAIGTEKQ
jgi:hypothetical protein